MSLRTITKTTKLFFLVSLAFTTVDCSLNKSFANYPTLQNVKSNSAEDASIKNYVDVFDIRKNDENLKGHTVKKHIGKSKDWLEGRLCGERHQKFASSYSDFDTANKVIKQVILTNEKKVVNWLRGNEKSITLHESFDEIIGITLQKEDNKSQDCKVGVVVLKRTKRDSKDFFVVTSYPVLNEKDITFEYKKRKYTMNNRYYDYTGSAQVAFEGSK